MASKIRDLESEDENALVNKSIKGDANAFGILYNRHLQSIFRYIYFRVGDEMEAEDMTEEVFVRAWEALPRYQFGKYPFTSWIYRIAHNLVVDGYRRKPLPAPVAASDMALLPDREALPEDLVLEKDESAALVQAIQKLGDEEQQVIVMRFIQGLTHTQIGKIIGKTKGASRVIQHRALKSLNKLLSSRLQTHDQI